MQLLLTATYILVAIPVLLAGLACAPKPGSTLLVVVSALLWPLTMAAVALHASLVTRSSKRRSSDGHPRELDWLFGAKSGHGDPTRG